VVGIANPTTATIAVAVEHCGQLSWNSELIF
jgi:hypothetical protein